MTAAIGAEAAGAGGAAAGAGRAVPAAASTGSAPVGTAPSAAGKPGYKPRTRPQLGPGSGSKSAPRNKYNPAGKPTPGPSGTTTTKHGPGGVGGKTTTTRKGRSTTTTTSKRSGFPLFFGGKKGKGKGGHAQAQARSLLMGEFISCAVIVAFSPLTDRHKSEGPAKAMKRITALAGVFLVLALVSTGGKGATRVAAAFGGLVTVALLVSERDLFAVIAKRFNDTSTPAGPAGPDGGGGAAAPPAASEQLGPIETIPGFNNPPPSTGHWWDGIIGGLGPI